jgi:hypothetical protein
MKQLDLFDGSYETKKALTRDDLETAVIRIFKDISLEKLVGLITNELEEVVEYYKLSNGEKACQKTSLLFNPHRLCTRSKGKPFSIYEGTKTYNFLTGLARTLAYRYNTSNGRARELLYNTLQFGGINNSKYVNEFPPHVARDLCKEFGVNKTSHILDPCAGWGGRMIGCSVVCDNYTCFEPSSKTYTGLLKLEEFIKSMNKSFSANVNCLPFEDSEIQENKYDFALTSPPYYDTEDYSDEETNSKNRYKSFKEWCDYFYIPMIQKTMNALKSNCCFVLNIGSRIYPLNKVLLDNFGDKYKITKHKDLLMGNNTGLRSKDKEGESFYIIRKS